MTKSKIGKRCSCNSSRQFVLFKKMVQEYLCVVENALFALKISI